MLIDIMEIKKNKSDIDSTNEVLVFCEKYIYVIMGKIIRQ